MSSNQDATEPGLGKPAVNLQRENEALKRALVAAHQAAGKPPRTPRQKRAGMALSAGKYAAVLSLAGLVARLIAKKFPQYEELIDGLLSGVGL